MVHSGHAISILDAEKSFTIYQKENKFIYEKLGLDEQQKVSFRSAGNSFGTVTLIINIHTTASVYKNRTL